MKYILFLLFANNTQESRLASLIDSSSYVYLAQPIYIYEIKRELVVKFDELPNNLDSALLKAQGGWGSHSQIYYVFEIQETLKGDEKQHITISFFSDNNSESCNLVNSYDNHNDDLFWSLNEGRSIEVNYPETHLIHSCFEPGKSYLLLNQYHLGRKAYELINSSDDKWLKFVRESLKK